MNGLLVEKLVFAYPKSPPVLDGVDLAVNPGEVVCLVGANGAGKSTLLACILGFLEPQGGRILVDGIDRRQEPKQARARLAFLPESVALWGFLTALEHLRLFAELTGSSPDPGTALRRVGLPEEAWRRPVATFSKGMRQKLALALVTMHQPAVVLFDEPTSGLDPESAKAMVGLLRSLAAAGTGALVVTHDLWLASQVAHRWGLLRGGKVVPWEGPGQTAQLAAL